MSTLSAKLDQIALEFAAGAFTQLVTRERIETHYAPLLRELLDHAIAAAQESQPLMGVQRREDVARALYAAQYPGYEKLFDKHLAAGGGDTGESDAMLKKTLRLADAVLALPHTGQPQDEVRVTLETHGQQSCYYGRLVSIEPYVAEKRGEP